MGLHWAFGRRRRSSSVSPANARAIHWVFVCNALANSVGASICYTSFHTLPSIWFFSLAVLAPNAGRQVRLKAGAERVLSAVAFRVKAPVARRPPHRSGREGFPHPVPR